MEFLIAQFERSILKLLAVLGKLDRAMLVAPLIPPLVVHYTNKLLQFLRLTVATMLLDGNRVFDRSIRTAGLHNIAT